MPRDLFAGRPPRDLFAGRGHALSAPDTSARADVINPDSYGPGALAEFVLDPLAAPFVSGKRMVTGQTKRENTWGSDAFNVGMGALQAVPLVRAARGGVQATQAAAPFVKSLLRPAVENAAIMAAGEGGRMFDETRHGRRIPFDEVVKREAGAAVGGAAVGTALHTVGRLAGGKPNLKAAPKPTPGAFDPTTVEGLNTALAQETARKAAPKGAVTTPGFSDPTTTARSPVTVTQGRAVTMQAAASETPGLRGPNPDESRPVDVAWKGRQTVATAGGEPTTSHLSGSKLPRGTTAVERPLPGATWRFGDRPPSAGPAPETPRAQRLLPAHAETPPLTPLAKAKARSAQIKARAPKPTTRKAPDGRTFTQVHTERNAREAAGLDHAIAAVESGSPTPADALVVEHAARKAPPPTEVSAAPSVAPQDSGPVGGHYTVQDTGTGRLRYKVLDTETGKAVKNARGPADRRFASAADAQAHAEELSAAKGDALTDIKKQGLTFGGDTSGDRKGGLRAEILPGLADALHTVGPAARKPYANLRSLGAPGHVLADALTEAQRSARLMRSKDFVALRDAGLDTKTLHAISPWAQVVAHGVQPLEAVPEALRGKVATVTRYLADKGTALKNAGYTALDAEQFGTPHRFAWDHLDPTSRNYDAGTRERTLQMAQWMGVPDAEPLLDAALRYRRTNEPPLDNPFIQHMIDQHTDWAPQEVVDEVTRQLRGGSLVSGESKQRVLDMPFWEPDLSKTLPHYIGTTAHKLAEVQHLGAPIGHPDNLVERVRTLPGLEMTPEKWQRAEKAIQAIRGVGDMPSSWLPEDSKALTAGRGIQSLVIGPRGAMANVLAGDINLLAQTDPLTFVKAKARTFRAGAVDDAYRTGQLETPLQIGTGEARGLAGESPFQKFLRGYHLPLRASEGLGRSTGAEGGEIVADRMAGRLTRNPHDQTAQRVLGQAGVTPERAGTPEATDRMRDLYAGKTMGDFQPGNVPNILRSPVFKIMHPFFTPPALQVGQALDATVGRYRREGLGPALYGGAAFLGGNLAAGEGRRQFDRGMTTMRGGDAGDPYPEGWLMRDALLAPALGPASDALWALTGGNFGGGSGPVQAGKAYWKMARQEPMTEAEKRAAMGVGGLLGWGRDAARYLYPPAPRY